jgi:hypothetical protein
MKTLGPSTLLFSNGIVLDISVGAKLLYKGAPHRFHGIAEFGGLILSPADQPAKTTAVPWQEVFPDLANHETQMERAKS